MQVTNEHKKALMLADAKVPQTWTAVIDELRADGAIQHGRYYLGQFGQGWLFDVTPRGVELMSEPTPVARGNGKRLAQWANGHR